MADLRHGLLLTAVLGIGLAGGAATGIAQSAPPGASPAQPMPAPAAPTRPAQAPDPAATRVAARITELHRRLQITPAQSQAWDAFAQVMRDNAAAMDAIYAQATQHGATSSAVDDLEAYAALTKAHADEVQRLVPPFTALYATMTDRQKRLADSVFRHAEARRDATAAAHG